MAQKFVTPITIKNLASSGSDALTVFLNGEAYGRVKLEAGGRISWSDGTGSYDTNIYRDSANVLATDDVLKATAGIITMAVAGVPTAPLADGALAVDTTNNTFYFRANGAWSEISGNSTITVSDTAPADSEVGALWFDSTSLEMFIYYGSAWVQLNADTGAEELSDLFDIEFANLIAGQILKYDGEKWVNETGSSTTVSDTAPANSASGDLWYDSSTLGLFIYYGGNWVELNADTGAEELSDLIDVNLTSLTNGQVLKYNGTEWVNAADNAGTSISSINDINDVTVTSVANGQVLQWNGTAWVNVAASTVGATNLNGLSDVVISTPEEFQTLEYDGTNWVNTYSSVVSYVRNAEATTLTTGTVVYLFGATGDHATVKRADNDSDATSSKTVGVVGANILASENGPVVTRGYVDGIDLSVGYTSGDILWLGEDGGFTKTKPTAPEHLVFVGVVIRATSNGIIYVATQNGYELDELHDVSITSPTSGQFLKWNGSLWVNASIPAPVTVSDTFPASPIVGNLWFESDTGAMFVYYDSHWIEISGGTVTGGGGGGGGTDEGAVAMISSWMVGSN